MRRSQTPPSGRSQAPSLGRDPFISQGPAGFNRGSIFLPLLFLARALSQAPVGSSFVRAHVFVRALQQFGVCPEKGLIQGICESRPP